MADLIDDDGENRAARVTPADLQANIKGEYYFTAVDGVGQSMHSPNELRLLILCVLVLNNGFTGTGESACTSRKNVDVEIGRKIARQNAEQNITQKLSLLINHGEADV